MLETVMNGRGTGRREELDSIPSSARRVKAPRFREMKEDEDLQDQFNVLRVIWQHTDSPTRIGCDTWPLISDWMPTEYIWQFSPMSRKTNINSN